MTDHNISIKSDQLLPGSSFSVEGRPEVSISDLLDAVPDDAPQASLDGLGLVESPDESSAAAEATIPPSPESSPNEHIDLGKSILDALIKIEKRARAHGRPDVVILLDELSLVADQPNWPEMAQEKLQRILNLISFPAPK
jgi:hypothetical protein